MYLMLLILFLGKFKIDYSGYGQQKFNLENGKEIFFF